MLWATLTEHMVDTMTILSEVLVGVLAGLIYGFVWYARNRYKKDESKRETFNPRKLIATLLVAGFIGGIMGASGTAITFETLSTRIGFYGFTIVLVEGVLKTLNEQLQVFPTT